MTLDMDDTLINSEWLHHPISEIIAAPTLVLWLEALLRLVDASPQLEDQTVDLLWAITHELNHRRSDA